MSDDLMAQLRKAVKEPELIITLKTNLFFGEPLIHLSKPGATPGSKPVDLGIPVIVGDADTQPHSEMLRMLANLMDEEGR